MNLCELRHFFAVVLGGKPLLPNAHFWYSSLRENFYGTETIEGKKSPVYSVCQSVMNN